jgi:hypothetical protein
MVHALPLIFHLELNNLELDIGQTEPELRGPPSNRLSGHISGRSAPKHMYSLAGQRYLGALYWYGPPSAHSHPITHLRAQELGEAYQPITL